MRKKRLLPVFLCCIWLNPACHSYPEADYYEVQGIVSVHASQAVPQNNWKAAPHKGSVSFISAEDTSRTGGTQSFSFYLNQPGNYAIWILSARYSLDKEENFLPIRVENEDGFLMEAYRLKLPDSNVPEWVNEDHSTEEPVMIQLSEPGHYTVRFESRGEPGYIIGRLHLALNNMRKPEGMGYPETRRPDIDPLLAKRDQPVVLPPAWAFGVLYRGPETTAQVRRLAENVLPADAYWIDSDISAADQLKWSEELSDVLNENGIRLGFTANDRRSEPIPQKPNEQSEKGPAFFRVIGTSNVSELQAAYETTQTLSGSQTNRGFVLADLTGLDNPGFKKYPTQLMETRYGWPGLKEAIESGANSRLSTYEVPFLTQTGEAAPGDITEELYMRWLQFSAFNPVMIVFPPADAAEAAMNQFQNLTHLRNRLFPYIYSQGHRLRATGEKPVTGDGIHHTQFMFGEAFLVAPVYEKEGDHRQVYFPEGTWYDYWDGTFYEGDQSWIVEAGPAKVPVFVKAGSIIPYRHYSRTVSEGTNQQLKLEVYTGGAGTFRLYEDDGESLAYQHGEFATTAFRYFEQSQYATFTIGAVVGSFDGQLTDKHFSIHFKYADEPVEIEAGGQKLETGSAAGKWKYDPGKKEVVINWKQPDRQKTEFTIRW